MIKTTSFSHLSGSLDGDPQTKCVRSIAGFCAVTRSISAEYLAGVSYYAGMFTGCTLLHIAASRALLDMCKELVDLGSDADFTVESQYTPLMRAAEMGSEDVCNFLLSAQANVNNDGLGRLPEGGAHKGDYSALMAAADNGKANICRLLIDANGDVNFATNRGYEEDYAGYEGYPGFKRVNNALKLAIQAECLETCQVLLAAGAKVAKKV